MKRFHIIARALVLSGQHVLLAHQKGASNTFLPGGHIDTGESAAFSIQREIHEELGLDSEIEHFLGCVEADWVVGGQENYEINLIFKTKINDLNHESPLVSREKHLEFFWSQVSDLDKNNLLPYPLRKLITGYVSGDMTIWWATTLP
jgi:8-oxo-dGTP pyrophosphatase MutT (NUDIX family)